MKPLSDRELRMNEQAVTIAASVLSQAVEAATRCEQITRDIKAQTMSMEGILRVDTVVRGVLQPKKARALNELETAGLPNSFIFAVTTSHVHAIEDKHSGEHLVPGDVLRSWDRAGVKARHATENFYSGTVSNDRQVLILYLPIEGGDGEKIRYLTPAGRTRARARGDMPHQFIFARDAPSQRVIDALGTTGPLVISGHGHQYPGGASASVTPSPVPTAQRLLELETLRANGVLSDAEYTRKREQIISEI